MQFDPGHEYFKAERGSQSRGGEGGNAIGQGNDHSLTAKSTNSSANNPLS